MGTKVKKWVQNLVADAIGPCPLQVGGKYTHPADGPIEITDGQYWGEYGLSNFWYWKVIARGEEKWLWG